MTTRISRDDIFKQKHSYKKDSISQEQITQISKVLKYVTIKKAIIFNKNIVVGILNKLSEKNKEEKHGSKS